jgi:hypothetical protein
MFNEKKKVHISANLNLNFICFALYVQESIEILQHENLS